MIGILTRGLGLVTSLADVQNETQEDFRSSNEPVS